MLQPLIAPKSLCKAQLLRQKFPKSAKQQSVLFFGDGYTVRELITNLRLITVADQVPVTTKCSQKGVQNNQPEHNQTFLVYRKHKNEIQRIFKQP